MNQIGLGIFLLFLITAAGQDLKSKSVAAWVYLVFGIMAAVWNLAAVTKAAGVMNTEGIRRLCMDRAISCSIGLCLLLLGRASRGSIGTGDGCFFLVSGLLLDIGRNFWLLSAGIFLCGIISLGILVRAQIGGTLKRGRDTMAFLPFVAAAGVAGAAAGVIRM